MLHLKAIFALMKLLLIDQLHFLRTNRLYNPI
jgi:hypothetical protein